MAENDPKDIQGNTPIIKPSGGLLMKGKKVWILIIFTAVIAAILIYYTQPAIKRNSRAGKIKPQESNINTAQLEAQVQQLKDLLHAVVQLNRKLEASFQKEKGESQDLEKTLKDASAKNEALLQELAQAKIGLALTQPIKQKMNEVETLLPKLNIAPGNEKEISQLLQEIQKMLGIIDTKIPGFLNENKSYKEEAQNLRQLLLEKESDIANLNTARETQFKELEALKMNLKNISEEPKNTDNASPQTASSQNKEIHSLKKELQKTHELLTQAYEEKGSVARKLEDTLLRAQESTEKLEEQKKEARVLAEKLQSAQNGLAPLKKQLSRVTEQNLDLSKKVAEAEPKNTSKLREEITELNRQLGQLEKEYAQLKEAYASTQETIAQNELELGKRANRILTTEEKRADAENRLSELQLKLQEIEKEIASLREQNVAVQLERETLRTQLNRTKLKLSELEGQASLISNILKTTKPSEGETPLPQEEVKKIELELYPVNENEVPAENKNAANESAAEKPSISLGSQR